VASRAMEPSAALHERGQTPIMHASKLARPSDERVHDRRQTPFMHRSRARRACRCHPARFAPRLPGISIAACTPCGPSLQRKEPTVLITILVIVLIVLALGGFFGRGRFGRR
jgi:hypothetical protein